MTREKRPFETHTQRFVVGMFLLAGLAVPLTAKAQRPAAATAQVVDLNRQAMEAYSNLDVDRATQLLTKALDLARTSNVTGAPLARTHLNRGVVQVGGLADNAAGIDSFVEALRVDPNIRLDPLTSTPDIEAAFNLAKQRAGAAAPAGPGGAPGPGAAPGPGGAPGPGAAPGAGGVGPAPGGSLIAHVPPPEQLQMTPVPIYLEIAPFVTVGEVHVFYKGLGMPDFVKANAERIGNGWGVEIDCLAVFPPQVLYYIAIMDPAGQAITYAGSPQQAIVVPVVTARTREEIPALPGRDPPASCNAEGECPPGMEEDDPRCHRAGSGVECGDGACTGDEDITCPRDCMPGGGGGGGDDGAPTLPSVFVSLGIGTGLALARTDTVQNPDRAEVTCTGGEPAANCLDVQGGLAWLPPGVRIMGGFFLTDAISLGLSFRYQLIRETREEVSDKFTSFNLEARLAYWFNRALDKKMWFYGFAGTGYGMVQPQVTVSEDANAVGGDPQDVTVYQNAGLNSVTAGGGVVYHFSKPGGFALLGELDMDYFFPTTLVSFDLWIGAEMGF